MKNLLARLLGRSNDQKPNDVNHQQFKLAAPGTGVIVFKRSSLDQCSLQVLLSMRASAVGAGYGYTGGGFVECRNVLALPVGEFIDCVDEAYRESGEENGGFEAVISREDFFLRAQPIATFNARSADINQVHACTVFALGVSDEEWTACLNTSATSERNGSLQSVQLSWDAGLPRRNAHGKITLMHDGKLITSSDFFHRHETVAFGSLAWHAHHNLLWL